MDLQAKSDRYLLELSTREPRAFAVLVDRYQQSFLRRACRILHDVDEAEDAVQDAFVRIYAAAPRFQTRRGASFQSWAYKILTNVCLRRYRQRQKQAARFAPLGEAEETRIGDESGFERRFQLDYLVSLLGFLPELWRRALTLRYFHGLSYEELARREGVSLPAMRARVSRAKKFLVKKFDDGSRT